MPEEDDIATRRIEKIIWLPPVARVDDLPRDGVLGGTMCFVETDGEEEVWRFDGNTWIRVDML